MPGQISVSSCKLPVSSLNFRCTRSCSSMPASTVSPCPNKRHRKSFHRLSWAHPPQSDLDNFPEASNSGSPCLSPLSTIPSWYCLTNPQADSIRSQEMICVLTRVESREIMRSVTKVGGRVPMVASGLGKALLSTYSEQDVFAIIQREGMPRLTSKSIVRAGELCKSLHDIRQQGYSVDDEEALIGLRCVSAVVYDGCSEPLAAISVSGKTSRVPNDRLPILGKLVQEVAAELTRALGGASQHEKSS